MNKISKNNLREIGEIERKKSCNPEHLTTDLSQHEKDSEGFNNAAQTIKRKFLQSGIVLLDKPKGLSSFMAVKLVQRSIGAVKAGHMGTLDPMASGLLVIGVNKGTKLFEKFLQGEKEYLATFEFGSETTTLDAEGEVVKHNDIKVEKEDLLKLIPALVGQQMQIPPAYSAKKINGKKAYELARENKDFQLDAKKVSLFDLQLLGEAKQNTFTFKICCSSGFYVRSLGRDMAAKLSTYATTTCIRRTKCCGFDIHKANTIEEIKMGIFNFIDLETINIEN